MSDIKINNITSFGGSNGPVISGITTAEGSFFGLPRGDTAYRGGRGRGIFGGGRLNSDLLNNIDYITISTTGDARDFGDITSRGYCFGTSNSTRGIIAGGITPSVVNTIEYITIATTGNSTDYGDLTEVRTDGTAASDSHGGLG